MSGSFALPPGFVIGSAPPAAPPQGMASPGVASAQPAAAEPASASAPTPGASSNAYALPPGYTIGSAPPDPNATTTNYIDVSASGQDPDQADKPAVPASQFPQSSTAGTPSTTIGGAGPAGTLPGVAGSAIPPASAAAPAVAAPGAAAPPGAYIAPPTPPTASVSPQVPPAVAPAPSLPGPAAGGTMTAPTAGAPPALGPDPNAPAAPGWTLPYAGHLAGLAERDLIEGGLGLGLGPASLAARGVDYLTGSTSLAPIVNASQGLSNFLTSAGFAQPQNTAERYGSAIAENVLPALVTAGAGAVPSVIDALSAATVSGKVSALAAALASHAAPAAAMAAPGAGAGVLQQYAAEHGAGRGAQLAAALLGMAAGGGVAGAARAGADYGARLGVPLTGGRAGLAGQALLSQSSEPATFASRLAAGLADQNAGTSTVRLPTSPATLGMLARDQGMMGFEQGIRNNAIGNDSYRDFDAARSASQVAAIKDLQDPGAHSAAERGFTVRNALDQAHDAAAARTSQAYSAAAPSTAALPLDSVHDHISQELDGVYGPGSGGPPGPLKGAWRELAQRKSMPGPHLTRMSQRLGNMAGQFKMQGNRMAAAAAMRTRDVVDNLSGSPAWEQARAMRRSQGEAFGRNAEGANAVGGIRAEDRFGSPMMQDDKVADRAIRDAASVRQVTTALQRGVSDARAGGVSPAQAHRLEVNAADVRTAMREHFIDGLMRKGSVTRDEAGNETVKITPKQWSNYWRDRKDVADQLFTPGERTLLDNDFAEQHAFEEAGRSNGSNTAKNGSTAKFMKSLAAGKIPGELRTARIMAAGLPLAIAKGSTTALDAVAPGVGRGLEHAAHRGAEFYFLTRGGHDATQSVLGGLVNPGAHAVAERVQEAAGNPHEVQQLISAVRAGKVARLSAAASPRPLRYRATNMLWQQSLRRSPAVSQAQQGGQQPRRLHLAQALADAA